MLKRILFALSVAGLALTSCNPSLQKVASQANHHDKNYSTNTLLPLEAVYLPSSIDNMKLKEDKDNTSLYKSNVYSASLNMMDIDLGRNSFSNSSLDFNGYIRCQMVYNKEKLRLWGIAPMVATCLYYTLCGGPMGHVIYEREYKFDVVDAKGQLVKSYTIKGKKNNTLSLYSAGNRDGSDLAAFRNALKEFERQLSNDSGMLNSRLKASSNEIKAKINRPFSERDEIMTDWLNSGEYPSLAEMNQGIANAPDDYVAWGLRAMYNYENGRYSDALYDLDNYCNLNPTCKILYPHFYRAEILYSLNRKDEALEALQLAKAYYGENENFYLLEGAIYVDYGALQPPLKSMQAALKVNPDNLSTIQNVADLKRGIENVAAERKRQQREEQLQKTMAIAQVANAAANITNSIAQLNNVKNSTVQTNTVSTGTGGRSSSSTLRAKTKDCSMCHGKGWVAGTSGVSMDANHSYYCNECHREVPSSHSHDTCKSCGGRGQVTTL